MIVAVGEQAAQVGGAGGLAGVRADRLDSRIERPPRAFRRFHRHRPGDVGDASQLLGADQGVGQNGRADLGSVDERQSLLGLRPIRFQVDAPQGRASAHRLSAFGHRLSAIGRGTNDEGVSLTHDDEGQMGQRREIAGSADAALLGDGRHHAAVVHLDELVDQLRCHSRMSLGQRLDAQSERESADAETQQRSHADRMAAQQILLQGEHLVWFDALAGELAEAGVDTIQRLALRKQIVQAAAPAQRAGELPARGGVVRPDRAGCGRRRRG